MQHVFLYSVTHTSGPVSTFCNCFLGRIFSPQPRVLALKPSFGSALQPADQVFFSRRLSMICRILWLRCGVDLRLCHLSRASAIRRRRFSAIRSASDSSKILNFFSRDGSGWPGLYVRGNSSSSSTCRYHFQQFRKLRSDGQRTQWRSSARCCYCRINAGRA